MYFGFVTALAFVMVGGSSLILLFGSSYIEGAEIVVLLGIGQAIRIAKSGPMVIAMSCGETKIPMQSNMIRLGTFLLAAVSLVFSSQLLLVVYAGLIGELLALIISVLLLGKAYCRSTEIFLSSDFMTTSIFAVHVLFNELVPRPIGYWKVVNLGFVDCFQQAEFS
jgi:hypothetical protein